MSISFPELIVCLLPGFLGLWVFKRSVQEDIDKRGEGTQTALALLFGVFALVMLSAVNQLLRLMSCAAEYITPSALSVGTSDGVLNIDLRFCLSYAVLCVLAAFGGGLWGFLSERGLSLTRWLPSLVCGLLGHEQKTPCESSLRGMLNEMEKADTPPSLVMVYPLGERENALVGFWNAFSETEKELELHSLELCDSDTNLVEMMAKQHRRCWVNHNSGVVVEFIECGREQCAQIQRHLFGTYEKILQK